jgi:hypothetical protein
MRPIELLQKLQGLSKLFNFLLRMLCKNKWKLLLGELRRTKLKEKRKL